MGSCTTDDVIPEEIDESLPQQAVFDFTSSDAVTGWGIAIPGGSAGTEIEKIVQKDVTIAATKGSGSNHARIYATGSGVLDLRVYAGDALTFSVPEGYIITGMQWSSANEATMDDWNPSYGTVAGGVWTAPSDGALNSLTMTATGTTRMKVLTVTYVKGEATLAPVGPTPEEPGEEPTPEVPGTTPDDPGTPPDDPGVTPEDPVTLTLDFTDEASVKAWGYEKPGASAGLPLTGAITIEKFTLTPANTEGATDATKIRLYTAKNGLMDLRIYKGDAITYSVPEGYVIDAISWTSANTESIDAWTPSEGTLNGGVWTGEAGKTYNSITFTATGTTRINVLTVTYSPVKQ